MHSLWINFRACNRNVVGYKKPKNKTMNFFLKSVFLAAFILVASCFIPHLKLIAFDWAWMSTVLFYLILNIALKKWVDKVKNATPIKFITAIMGATTVKMLTTPTIVAIYLTLNQPEPWSFAIGAFSVFVLNTILFVADAQNLVRKG